MDSQKEFELFIKDVWQSPNLKADFYTEVPSGREYLMYDDLSIHQTWVGWQARQPELDKKDEQIKLLREFIVEYCSDTSGCMVNGNLLSERAKTALEETKGE